MIHHITEKKMTKEMFDALVNLNQNENINKKMIFHNRLKYVELTRSDTVNSYLMKVT